jgi:hypothetical protein
MLAYIVASIYCDAKYSVVLNITKQYRNTMKAPRKHQESTKKAPTESTCRLAAHLFATVGGLCAFSRHVSHLADHLVLDGDNLEATIGF